MRRLIWIIAIAAFALSLFWVAMGIVRTRVVDAWLAERRDAGFLAEAGDVSTSGFPIMVNTRLSALELADPTTGVAFATSRADIKSPLLRPTRFTLSLPAENILETTTRRLKITGDPLSARLHMHPTAKLEIEELSSDIANLTLSPPDGAPTTLETLKLRALHAGDDAPRYTITLNASNLVLGGADAQGNGILSNTVESTQVDADILFDAPWGISRRSCCKLVSFLRGYQGARTRLMPTSR